MDEARACAHDCARSVRVNRGEVQQPPRTTSGSGRLAIWRAHRGMLPRDPRVHGDAGGTVHCPFAARAALRKGRLPVVYVPESYGGRGWYEGPRKGERRRRRPHTVAAPVEWLPNSRT